MREIIRPFRKLPRAAQPCSEQELPARAKHLFGQADEPEEPGAIIIEYREILFPVCLYHRVMIFLRRIREHLFQAVCQIEEIAVALPKRIIVLQQQLNRALKFVLIIADDRRAPGGGRADFKRRAGVTTDSGAPSPLWLREGLYTVVRSTRNASRAALLSAP